MYAWAASRSRAFDGRNMDSSDQPRPVTSSKSAMTRRRWPRRTHWAGTWRASHGPQWSTRSRRSGRQSKTILRRSESSWLWRAGRACRHCVKGKAVVLHDLDNHRSDRKQRLRVGWGTTGRSQRPSEHWTWLWVESTWSRAWCWAHWHSIPTHLTEELGAEAFDMLLMGLIHAGNGGPRTGIGP